MCWEGCGGEGGGAEDCYLGGVGGDGGTGGEGVVGGFALGMVFGGAVSSVVGGLDGDFMLLLWIDLVDFAHGGVARCFC